MDGTRITDAVDWFERRGQTRGAVKLIRHRRPDKLRWRSAVGKLSRSAGGLRGRERMRIEEPVREVVLDLGDPLLQREVVLDARRVNVDLDRGELLPVHSMGDLRRNSFLVGADVGVFEKYVHLPEDFDHPVDTAGCALVARAMANHHRRRAQGIWLELPDPEGPTPMRAHHQHMARRAQVDADIARRWSALLRVLLGDTPAA